MSEEKTEDPTEARKREARLKGQVLKSQELVSAATLTASFAVIVALAPTLISQLVQLLRTSFLTFSIVDNPMNILRKMTGSILLITVAALLPAMLCSALTGLGFNLLTTNLGFSPKALTPDLSKMNPVTMVKRWFSKRTLMEGVKLVIKTTATFWIVWTFWRDEHRDFLSVSRQEVAHFSHRFESIVSLAWRLVAVQVVFGAVDYAIQYYEHRQSMKMSKQEVKDEHKKQEGDPMIKAQRRARARRMIKSAGMNKLPEASVVITNPTHLAVALKFHMTMPAPVVVSKGADRVAFEIRKRARALQIPIVENKPLARALFPLELEDTIPPELFKTVAELLLSVRDAEEYY